jgi:hypothetical protein
MPEPLTTVELDELRTALERTTRAVDQCSLNNPAELALQAGIAGGIAQRLLTALETERARRPQQYPDLRASILGCGLGTVATVIMVTIAIAGRSRKIEAYREPATKSSS